METLNITWLNLRDPGHPQAGGSELYLSEVGRRLAARGHRVSVFAQRYPGAPKFESIMGIDIFRVTGSPLALHLAAPIISWNSAHRPDVVIDHVAHSIPWFSPLLTGGPVLAVVHHVHGNVLYEELGPLRARMVRVAESTIPYVYRRIVSSSMRTREDLVRLGCDPSSVSVVYCGVDRTCYKPGTKSDRPLVLCVSRLKRYKGISALLKAWRFVETWRTDAQLVIVGEGDAREDLEHQARELNLASVSFLGKISDEQKVALLQKAWIHVAPSMKEGWGMAVMEAGACGTPSIGFADSGLDELLSVIPRSVVLRRSGEDEFGLQLVDYLDSFDGKPSETEWALRFDWERTAELMYGHLSSL